MKSYIFKSLILLAVMVATSCSSTTTKLSHDTTTNKNTSETLNETSTETLEETSTETSEETTTVIVQTVWTDSDIAFMENVLGKGNSLPFFYIEGYKFVTETVNEDTYNSIVSETAGIDAIKNYSNFLENEKGWIRDDNYNVTGDDAKDFYAFKNSEEEEHTLVQMYLFKNHFNLDMFKMNAKPADSIKSDITLTASDFPTGYPNSLTTFTLQGMSVNIINIMSSKKGIQFSSTSKREGGFFQNINSLPVLSSIKIVQNITGYDGTLSVKMSTDGISFAEVNDSYGVYILPNAKFFRIENTSSSNALYLTSILFDFADLK